MGKNALYALPHIHKGPYLRTRPAPPSPQKNNLNNLCLSFLLGITAVPREIENNAYTNFWGANKFIMGNVEVAYGRITLVVARFLIVFSGSGSSLFEARDSRLSM